jgi:UDP-glucose 4-epimerase
MTVRGASIYNWRSMNEWILVTGAAGFIGSHLIDRLLAQGHNVIGIDNLILGRIENLKHALEGRAFYFIEEDLNSVNQCLEKIRAILGTHKITTVWHLAANSDIAKGVSDANVDLQNTFMSTFHTLQIMKSLEIPKLVFASSSAIYGDRQDPLSEDSGPLFPISNYGAMKLGSEGLITAALESYLEKVWIYRFPNVVGSRSTHGVIYDFVRKLRKNPKQLEVLGDGNQEKPYLHVSELLNAMLFVFERSSERLNCFNIGQDGNATTVRQIANMAVKHVSPKASIVYSGGAKGWVGDVPSFQFSISKIRNLGWRPKLNSDEAIEKAIAEIAAENL